MIRLESRTIRFVEGAKVNCNNGAQYKIEDGAIVIPIESDYGWALRNILFDRLPEFLDLFVAKNKEYGDNAETLGPRGQYADIHRKIAKLKTALWDDNEASLQFEGTDEILRDLIGHCFLTLQMRADARREEGGIAPASDGLINIQDAIHRAAPEQHVHAYYVRTVSVGRGIMECDCGAAVALR